MKALSSKAKVTLGLVGLTLSVMLFATMLELVPDPIRADRDSRATLAEVLASSSAGWAETGDLDRARDTIRLAVDRNPALLSAAMRRGDGTLVLEVGAHSESWLAMAGDYSTDAQIRVPILTGTRRWGELELRFEPLLPDGPAAFLHHPLVILLAFVTMACFFSFYVYLSKALAQLDPGKAVPGRVRSALDTMAEGLLVVERSGRVVLANRAFASMLGREPEALVGVIPGDLPFDRTAGDQGDVPRFPWIRALETGEEEYGVPMRLRDAGGETRALMVNCSPVIGVSGRPGGVLISFDDVTELEARRQQLRVAKDEADQANRAKSEFLANMSHEIRTPMNAILGFTDVLRRDRSPEPERVGRHLDIIHRSGTHLLELINDILDLSKVESGALEVEQMPVAPYGIIQDVISVLDVKAQEKGVALTYEPDGPTPETMLADPSRLRQILTNLVGNAIKFTEAGSVRVVTRLDRSGDCPEFEIQVHDSGVGIPADKLDTVFEAFAQADASVTRRFGGTGLGLPISRRFARAMGGDITVSSVPGEGSIFTLRLGTGALDGVAMLTPEQVQATAERTARTGARTWTFEGARVLVVDDAIENRSLLDVVLGDTGLTLLQAANGKEALDLLERESVDLVLMDMQMPIMDGYTATRELRARGVRTPVIALTAHAMQGYEQECRAAGCDDFVTKPVDIDRLLATMARWLPEQAREDASATSAAAPTVVAGAEASPLVSSLESDPGAHVALRGFAERLRESVAGMRTACESGDFAAVAEPAGWLAGAAGSMGFSGLTEPARALQRHAEGGDRERAALALDVVAALVARVRVPEVEAPAGPIVSELASDPRMHPIIRMFAQRVEDRLATVSGVKDLDELADTGHWLKGSAGMVGFTELTEPAGELERCARAGDAAGAEECLARLRELAARVEAPPEAASSGGT